MNPLTACCSAFLVGAFLLIGMHPAQSQTAEAILNKADAIYRGATSYQATYHWERKEFDKRGKLSYSEAEMVEVKTNSTTKFALHKVYEKPKGRKPNASRSWDSFDIVDDGSDQYHYLSGEKDYSRWMHDPDVFLPPGDYVEVFYMVIPQLKPRKGFTYTLGAPATINGKAAYVVQARGSVLQEIEKPPRWIKGHTIEVMFNPVTITEKIEETLYIDQATFHLLQSKATYTRPDDSTQNTLIMHREILDAPLPDSTFVFVAPEGVTELGIQKLKKK